MNLVSIIMQMLTPDLIGKLASGIGGDKSLVGKAIGALVPSILGSLVGVAAQPNGGSLLTNAISKLDPGLMGNLGSVLGGAGQGALATTGTNILGSLLGNSALGTLAGAVGKFSGLGGTASTGLVGALVPMILGSLGQQQKSMGLDAGGLAKLLGDQKSNINAAMPADFSKLLQGSGLLDGAMGQAAGAVKAATSAATGAASTATKAASSAASTATSAAKTVSSTAARTAEASEGGSNWLYWLLGLVALAAIAWFLAGRGAPVAPTAPAMTAPAAMIKVGDLDVTGTFNGALGKLTAALPTIRDEATAKAALPSLTDAQGAFDKIAGVYGQLGADAKPGMQGLAKTALSTLGPLVTAAMGNSAAGAVIKPALDGIMGKLNDMTK
jgi:Bacterial protein of unknown function (DUF937)